MLSPKARIQIVEDEFIIAEDLHGALEEIGHTVVGVAESYEEAVAHFEENQPELVLLDINLEGEAEGIKCGEILQEKGIPFIYISAYIDAKTRDKAEATNPKAFMVKPFDMAMLEVNIKHALSPGLSALNGGRRKEY
jgi:DNA-binding NtrC family response regulator